VPGWLYATQAARCPFAGRGERSMMQAVMRDDAPTAGPPASILRTATEADYPAVAEALQSWWTLPGLDTPAAARERAAMVPRLWLQHFATTSALAEHDGRLAGFLIAFHSQDRSDEGYIHFVGVAPDRRGEGLGRRLYERFFAGCRRAGRSRVRCITSPVNTISIAFHQAMGFALEGAGDAQVKPDYDGPGVARVAFVRTL